MIYLPFKIYTFETKYMDYGCTRRSSFGPAIGHTSITSNTYNFKIAQNKVYIRNGRGQRTAIHECISDKTTQ